MQESSVERQAEALLGTLLEGRYQIISLLGHGGMGVVYRARQVLMDRPVAIKMILGGGDDYDVARFQQEARASSQLKHANVITVYDFGVAENYYPYLVMDLLEGSSLAEILRVRGKIPFEYAVPMFCQLCDGLAHAHKKKVIHRDLKPSNIMITRDEDNNPVPVILDFGLAKLLPSEDRQVQKLTQTGTIFGTPHYMSPEQCMGTQVDHRTDIYAMGCIMYEVLSGRTAVEGDNFLQILQYHIGKQPLGFATLDGMIPRQLEKIVFKALAKNPQDRQQDMLQLKAELQEVLGPSREVPRAPGSDRALPGEPPPEDQQDSSLGNYDPDTYKPSMRTISQKERQADEQELQLIADLESAERQHGIASSDTLPFLESLAGYYKDVELYAEAESVYQKILSLVCSIFGERSKWTADTHEKLGFVCHMQNNYKDAVYHYLESCKLHKQINPEPTMDLAWVNYFAHQTFRQMDYMDHAEKHLREALEICEDYFPDANPDTFIDWATSAGSFFYYLKKDDLAQYYYKRCLEVAEKTWGEKHTNVMDPCMKLAEFYNDIGEVQKSEPLFRRAINIAHKTLPENDERFAYVSYKCGRYYYYIDDFEKAKKCFLTTLKIDEHNRGPDSVEHIYTLQFLGMVLRAMQDYSEADKHLSRAIKIAEANEGDDSEKLIDVLIEHGWALDGLRQNERAERSFGRALSIARKNFGKEKQAELEVPMRELGKYLAGRKMYERAEFTYRDLLDLQEELYGAQGRPLAATLYALADVLKYLGKTDAGMRYELRARAIETKHADKS